MFTLRWKKWLEEALETNNRLWMNDRRTISELGKLYHFVVASFMQQQTFFHSLFPLSFRKEKLLSILCSLRYLSPSDDRVCVWVGKEWKINKVEEMKTHSQTHTHAHMIVRAQLNETQLLKQFSTSRFVYRNGGEGGRRAKEERVRDLW